MKAFNRTILLALFLGLASIASAKDIADTVDRSAGGESFDDKWHSMTEIKARPFEKDSPADKFVNEVMDKIFGNDSKEK